MYIRAWFLLSLLISGFFLVGELPKAKAATLARPANNLGLVGYWNFNEGTGTQVGDFSGRSNTGVATTTTWVSGRSGKGMSFNGSTNYVQLSGTNVSFPNATFSVSLWMKENTYAPGNWIVGNGVISGGWGVRDDGVVFLKASNNSQSVYAPTAATSNTMKDGRWHHIVYIITTNTTTAAAQSVSMYIDGVLDGGSFDFATTYASNTDLTFGKRLSGGFWAGSLDEVRIYNRALTAAQILQLYRATSGVAIAKVPNKNGLVGEWKFDEGSGTQVGDTSGNKYNATLSGSTLPIWVGGKFGKALSFDGVTGYATASGTLLDLSGGTFTESIWIYNNVSDSGFHGFLGNQNGGTFNRYPSMWVNNYTSIHAGFGDGSGWRNFTTGSILTLNAWNHVVATFDGTTYKIYVNGVESYSTGTLAGYVPLASQAVDIGRVDNYFPGKVDDARIYRRALTATEVMSLYRSSAAVLNVNTASGGLANGLVGYWSFNGADITDKIYDRIGGFNGYLVGTNNATSSRKTPGKVGQGFTFGGVNTGGINLGNSTNLTPSRFTISAWINPSNPATYSYNYIYSNARDCCGTYNGIEFFIGFGTPAYLTGSIWNGSRSGISSNPTMIATSTWSHVAFSYDGAFMRLYINGELNKQQAQTIDPATPATFNTYLGSMGNSAGTIYTFNGKMDELRLYNRALSDAEVKQLYNAGK